MRILVCGGRDFNNYKLIKDTLDSFEISLIINGGARGADYLSTLYARDQNIERMIILARWDLYGRPAGHIRNKKMLEEGKPDLVIAFPGGKGTANMVKQAKEAGVKVIEVCQE